MEPENYEGNREYKLKLLDLNDEKFDKRATQMKFRIT